jgi:hypothetical protein
VGSSACPGPSCVPVLHVPCLCSGMAQQVPLPHRDMGSETEQCMGKHTPQKHVAFFFLVVLGFELGALLLLGRLSII